MRTHASRITSIALVSRSPTPPTPLSCRYIKSELDELEREEFFRLKRSQDKKKKDIKAKEAEKAAAAAAAAGGGGNGNGAKAAGAAVLPAEDPDVVF